MFSKKETIKAKGFFDSGNQALLKGRPVCFVSPELIYQLFGNEILKGGGQVCDELKIQTMSGEKTVCAYEGRIRLRIKGEELEKGVYFASSTNMLWREYNVIINAYIWDEG